MGVEKIVVAGPVIIENGRLLVVKDGDDEFYKLPGGVVELGERLEIACLREFNQETGLTCRILRKLPTMTLPEDSRTGKPSIELHHYKCEVITPIEDYKAYEHNGHEVKWIMTRDLTDGEYPLAPNIGFLVSIGVIK